MSEYIMPFTYAQVYQAITLLFMGLMPFAEGFWAEQSNSL